MVLSDLFDSDFSSDLSARLCKQVIIGTTALNRLLADNTEFFSYPMYSSVKGTLLNYSIENCLYNSAFTPDASYTAYHRTVNKFNYSVLHLQTDHFIVTAAKTHKWNQLPTSSKYKLEYARANRDGDGQYCLDFVNGGVSTEPYYALLTYGYNPLSQSCDHVDLLIPDADFNNILYRKNLLKVDGNLNIVPSAAEVEDTIARLKPELEKQIVLLKAK